VYDLATAVSVAQQFLYGVNTPQYTFFPGSIMSGVIELLNFIII
jgi:hypothetical protein